MSQQVEELKNRMHQLETQLEDAQKRLPAHSVKPPIMQQIFALEDEIEQLRRSIEKIEQSF